jgi:shikimate dehydrogenase
VYDPHPTPFMQLAKKGGAVKVADGLGMLVEQAAEAFFVWRGVHPQTAAVYQELRRRLDTMPPAPAPAR